MREMILVPEKYFQEFIAKAIFGVKINFVVFQKTEFKTQLAQFRSAAGAAEWKITREVSLKLPKFTRKLSDPKTSRRMSVVFEMFIDKHGRLHACCITKEDKIMTFEKRLQLFRLLEKEATKIVVKEIDYSLTHRLIKTVLMLSFLNK